MRGIVPACGCSSRSIARVAPSVILLLACASVAAATPKPVVIEKPNGGEVYIIGLQQQIRTAPKPKYRTIRIELSRDGGLTFPEVLGTIDNLADDKTLRDKLDWTVTGPASDACAIRAVGILKDLSEVESTSLPFSIGNLDVDSSTPDSRYVQVAGDTMTGNLAMSGNKVTGLGAATANGDVVRFEQAVKSGDSAGGDLTGTYPSPTVDATKVQKRVTGTAPTGEFITGINQDGTVNSAAGGGIPSGSVILTATQSPPSGFTFTGFSIEALSKWTTREPLPTPRRYFGYAVAGGKIYIIGGSVSGVASNLNEEYDPISNSWATKAPMPTARFFPAVAELGGKIYVTGGSTGSGHIDSHEVYDPSNNTWDTKQSMPTPRTSCRSISVNGKLYVIGGQNNISAQAATEEYDPDSDSWDSKADMLTPRTNFGIAEVNGKIYAIGSGPNPATVNEVFDPVADSWSAKAPLNSKQVNFFASVLDGLVYAIGGEDGDALSTNTVYDPNNDVWTDRRPVPTKRAGAAVAAVNGKIYVIGGNDNSGTDFSENEEFAPKVFFMHVKD